MTTDDRKRRRAMELRREAADRAGYKFRTYFPDCLPTCHTPSLDVEQHVVRPGDQRPRCRALYPRSLEFFAGGTRYRERLFLAANRTSKTVTAAYESTAHLTGAYPDWWPGRRFQGPIEAWAASDTRETTRDIVQLELCGPRESIRVNRYAGMIPAHLIVDRTLKTGVADCIDTAWIQHRERHHGAPALSTLQFKSYDQGRIAFQGTSKHLIWLDEEPPDATESPEGGGDIYTECLLRTATTDGLVLATFTPIRGLTPFVDGYLETADMVEAVSGLIVNAKVGMFGADRQEARA